MSAQHEDRFQREAMKCIHVYEEHSRYALLSLAPLASASFFASMNKETAKGK